MRVGKVSSAIGSKSEQLAMLGPVGFDVPAALRYLRPSFHPWGCDNRVQMQAWLKANEGRLRVFVKMAADPA